MTHNMRSMPDCSVRGLGHSLRIRDFRV